MTELSDKARRFVRDAVEAQMATLRARLEGEPDDNRAAELGNDLSYYESIASELAAEPTSPANTGVELVPLTLDHLPHVMTWVNDREVMLYFANRQTPISEEEERRYLEALIHSRNDRAYSIFADGEYVGQCSINQIYWPARNGRVFIVIRREAQGRGLGRAALTALLDEAFGELGLHKLWLIVRRDNLRAQALYLRLGFEFEGVLRDEYFVQGRFFDMVRMAAVRMAAVRVAD